MCSGVFTGLQSLKILSRQPAKWAPDALHSDFEPLFHGLSALTGLTRLIMQRVPNVCELIKALNSLVGLEVLSLTGVEHDADFMDELGSHLSVFSHLQRLELEITPLFAAAIAVGIFGRGDLVESAYGSLPFRSPWECGGDPDYDSEGEEMSKAMAVAGMDRTSLGPMISGYACLNTALFRAGVCPSCLITELPDVTVE